MSKFFLYARKSTDEADRQILSIDAQIAELKEFAEREHLEIVQTFIESQTAKEPGRPIFNEMLSLVEKGSAEGILSWHPDRLARNSVDGGRIIYLVDTEKLCQLKFPTFWFENTPQGKFMLSIAFGQSKYYIDNLSENVKRGLRQKIRRGEYPGVAPLGYLNDKLAHTIVVDREKFRLVRKMYELYATEQYTLKGLKNRMADLGLVSKKGRNVAISQVQYILQNIFYYGAFKFNGEMFQGKHEPAVSKKLFNQVQKVFADKSRPKSKAAKEYEFRGLFRCGECGCCITSENHKGHTYYRCTKKKAPCAQKYVREELLAANTIIELQKVSLSEDVKNKMLAELFKDEEKDNAACAPFAQNIRGQIAECEKKLEVLLDERLNQTITTEEYTSKKQKILNQKIENEQKLADFERKGYRWLEPLKNFISEAHQAQIVALQGNFSAQKNFLKKVGSNHILLSQRLLITFKNPWKILAEQAADLSAVALAEVEPHRGEAGRHQKTKTEIWLATCAQVRTRFARVYAGQ